MITPIILCGGVGSRLWPLSRQSYPKQFYPLVGSESLFRQTVRRADCENFLPPIVVTSPDYRFIVSRELRELCIEEADILLEPSPKNTAPAIFAACYTAYLKDNDAVVLVLPSDHYMANASSFMDVVMSAYSAAQDGKIVTFGINPIRPETGYGYIEISDDSNSLKNVKAFKEKPDLATAQKMLLEGNYLWNSGIFMFKASSMIAEAERLDPQLAHWTKLSVLQAKKDLCFTRLDSGFWQNCRSVSIDYAILENSSNIVCYQYNEHWTDLGDWHSVWQNSQRDSNENVIKGSAIALNTSNSLLWSESNQKPVVGIGLEDLIVVAMDDAVLVAPQAKSQEVSAAVLQLRQLDVAQVKSHAHEERPWGCLEVLLDMPTCKIKRLYIRAGGRLLLQSHKLRSEHWIVIEGTADVEVDGNFKKVFENGEIFIEKGQKHGLSNNTDSTLILIEVQVGDLANLDDTIRYEELH